MPPLLILCVCALPLNVLMFWYFRSIRLDKKIIRKIKPFDHQKAHYHYLTKEDNARFYREKKAREEHKEQKKKR